MQALFAKNKPCESQAAVKLLSVFVFKENFYKVYSFLYSNYSALSDYQKVGLPMRSFSVRLE